MILYCFKIYEKAKMRLKTQNGATQMTRVASKNRCITEQVAGREERSIDLIKPI